MSTKSPRLEKWGIAGIEDLDPQEHGFVTPNECAWLTGLSEGTVRRGIRTGEIPSQRIGERWYIPTAFVRTAMGLSERPAVAQG